MFQVLRNAVPDIKPVFRKLPEKSAIHRVILSELAFQLRGSIATVAVPARTIVEYAGSDHISHIAIPARGVIIPVIKYNYRSAACHSFVGRTPYDHHKIGFIDLLLHFPYRVITYQYYQ